MITRLSKVSVPVHDQARAAAFFSDVLGMTVRSDEPLEGGARWTEFAPAGSDVVIVPYTWWDDLGTRPGAFTGIVLECSDMAATYRRLTDRGATFTGPPEPGTGGVFATLLDPSGNRYTLVQPTNEPPGR
jgi:predicted enzyme related to lactoylglutathione lyase